MKSLPNQIRVRSPDVPDSVVMDWILVILDDYKKHDWDDAMIKVDQGFERAGMVLQARQAESCLYKLVDQGKVVEEWKGDWATLRRVRQPVKPVADQLQLFDEQ